MKAEDRLKELIESGEINSLDAAKQEGFIKGWCEALRIHGVVNRREQLLAFAKWFIREENINSTRPDTYVDDFLESQ